MQQRPLPPEEPRRMLIPQYSLRWLLGAITAAACFLSIVAVGMRGHAWALAVSVGLLAAAISAMVYAAAFGVVWLFSALAPATGGPPPEKAPIGSPFAPPTLEAGIASGPDESPLTPPDES